MNRKTRRHEGFLGKSSFASSRLPVTLSLFFLLSCTSHSAAPPPTDAGEEPDVYGAGLCASSGILPDPAYGTCIVGAVCPQSTLPAEDSTSCTVGSTCCLRQCTATGGGRCVPTGTTCAAGETMGGEEKCGAGFLCCAGGTMGVDAGMDTGADAGMDAAAPD
jgi:hypothetical protein